MRRAILFSATLFLIVLGVFTMGCKQDSVVRISAVIPLSGDFQIYGQPVKKGVEVAFEILEARGTLSMPLELEILDTESDTKKAAQLLEAALGNGAFAVIGGVTSGEALEMIAVADRFDRVLCSPSASSPQLTGISRNFYRVFPSDTREGTTMGNFSATKLQLETVVIVAKEETYAHGVQEVFSAEFERNGGKVLELIQYPEGGADFSGLLERVVGLDPDGVYLAAFANDISVMITELLALGFEGRILTTSAFSSVEAIEQLGEAAEGVLLTQAVFEVGSEEAHIKEFVSRYEEKFGFAPDLYAAHGYDAVMVMAEAMKEGNATANDFWKSMRSVRDFVGVTGTIQFDERGDVQKFPRVYGVQNGDLIDFEREIDQKRRRILDELRRIEEERRRRRQSQ